MSIEDTLYDMEFMMDLQNRMTKISEFFNKGIPIFYNDLDAQEFELWEVEYVILKNYFDNIANKRICINFDESVLLDKRLILIETYILIMTEENY